MWGDVRRLACRGSGGAGWERTGLAGGGLVLSAAAGGTQANQGMCIYAPALFCSEGIPENESRGTPTDRAGTLAKRRLLFIYRLLLVALPERTSYNFVRLSGMFHHTE